MQATSPSLQVLNPTNWSSKCRQTALLAIIATVALGAIYYLASSESKAWLRCQFMSEESACIRFKEAVKNDDPVMAKAILGVFCRSEKVKECLINEHENLQRAPKVVKAIWRGPAFISLFQSNDSKLIEYALTMEDIGLEEWKMPLDEEGNTVLQIAMERRWSYEWEEIAVKLLAKPFAEELLQVKNNKGNSPFASWSVTSKTVSAILKRDDFSAKLWKSPIDEEGNTVLQIAMERMRQSDECEEIAVKLLAKPFAEELLQVKNNKGNSPFARWSVTSKTVSAILKRDDFSAKLWKSPIDEEGNTVLQIAMERRWSYEWEEIAVKLLAKPFAEELLQVLNKEGKSPLSELISNAKSACDFINNYDISAEVLKSSINKRGNTVLHEVMNLSCHLDEWKSVVVALLAKPFAAELLQVLNKEGASPLSSLLSQPKSLCKLIDYDFPVEVWKNPIDAEGNTVLHKAMNEAPICSEWKEVKHGLLQKPFAAELLQVQNRIGVSPLHSTYYQSECLSELIEEYDFSVEVWKMPIDEDGNTVLHAAFDQKGIMIPNEWAEVAVKLLEKPFAVQLLGVKAINGKSPLDVFKGMSSRSIKIDFIDLLRKANEQNRVSTEVLQMLGIDTTEVKNVSGESSAEALPINT
ncbi:MAG: hypothetical protein H7A40_03275 [Chlamydiales bacterium]|nr:hypothetical protein [Chlamydiales bacterium]